jgi:hypothetical protein
VERGSSHIRQPEHFDRQAERASTHERAAVTLEPLQPGLVYGMDGLLAVEGVQNVVGGTMRDPASKL